MSNARIIKLLDELKSHLEMSQGGDLKSLLDQSKMDDAKVGVENPMEDSLETDALKPKGLSIEKVEVMGKPKLDEELSEQEDPKSLMPGEEEMTPEELEELLKKLS